MSYNSDEVNKEKTWALPTTPSHLVIRAELKADEVDQLCMVTAPLLQLAEPKAKAQADKPASYIRGRGLIW